MTRICPYCKDSFIPKRIDAIYCCPSHKQMAYKERKMNLSVNLRSLDRLELRENDADPSINSLSKNEKASTKLIYPSIDGSQINHNPSINVDVKNYPSTKMIYPSTIGLQQHKKPLINVEDPTDYPSTEESQEDQKPSINVVDVTNNESIDALEVNKNEQKDPETEYIYYKSSFVDALIELTNDRDNLSKLATLFWDDASGTYMWVSTRFKCLVECLLTFSEMKTIELDELKDICNAFTLLIRSNYFKSLPQAYPYTNEILELRESLKKICESAYENEFFKFRLLPQTKKNLIATRWELHYYAPKINFSELNFKE